MDAPAIALGPSAKSLRKRRTRRQPFTSAREAEWKHAAAIAAACAAGDRQAGGELVRRFEPLAGDTLRMMGIGSGDRYDDILQEARIGLLQGAKAWHRTPERDSRKLETYLRNGVRYAVLVAERFCQFTTLSIPIMRLHRARADRRGLPQSKQSARSQESYRKAAIEALDAGESLDAPACAGASRSIADELADRYWPTPAEAVERLEIVVRVQDALRAISTDLSPCERDVVAERLLAEEGEEQTLETIGDRYGISRERVRQLEARVLRRLRDAMEQAA